MGILGISAYVLSLTLTPSICLFVKTSKQKIFTLINRTIIMELEHEVFRQVDKRRRLYKCESSDEDNYTNTLTRLCHL